MQTDIPSQPSSEAGIISPDNVLFVLARTGRLRLPAAWLENHPVLFDRVLYPVVVLAFAFVAPLISGIIGLPLLIAGSNLNDRSPDLGFALFLLGAFLPLFFLVWIWLRIAEQRPLWTTGMTRPAIRPYLRGLLVGFLLFGTAVFLLALMGFVGVENGSPDRALWLTVAGTLAVLLGWAVQGAAEELLARGFLMPILGIRWNPLAAVIVSSLFFSALHLQNPNITAVSLLNLFLFGLFAALYALHEGNLWGAFAIHSIWNWAQGNLFGFEVSGLDTQSVILFDLMETGPDWVTGGMFGPEGGVAVTLVLISAILLLLFWSRRRQNITRIKTSMPG
jgi:CAAX protease family protein